MGILKSEKGTKIIFAAGIALIVIIFLFGIFAGGEKKQTSGGSESVLSELDEYERRLEERLAEIIGDIRGTEDISVMITLEKTEESLYSARETSVAATVAPTVRGVVVVCGGSESAVVRQKVTDAVCKALGISAARVCVTY
ncbi:MAG: hypothetical protein NC394_00385 [Bacteroides sp.]|nr:hypothetical protein [Bacteroides sp.]